MNNNKSIYKAFNAFKKSNDTSTPDNEYEPLEPLKIAKTIYPNGKRQMSLNGKDEWYGIQQK